MEKIDGLEFVRKNAQMFLSYSDVTGHELCSKILIDAITSGATNVIVRHEEPWWVVGSTIDWIGDNRNSTDTRELFVRIHANPNAGANAMRNEILLAAFADRIVLFNDRKTEVIRPGSSQSEPEFGLDVPSEFRHGVAFTLPHNE